MMNNEKYIGYVFDGGYKTIIRKELKKLNGKRVREKVWECPYYVKWKSMIERCEGLTFKNKYKTYTNVKCCEEWKLFSNFKRWMEQQDWEGKDLDKDFLCVGKDKIYSPDSCVFLPHELNLFIVTSGKTRGIYPLGVYYSSKTNKYISQIRVKGVKVKYLGAYDDMMEAHQAWIEAKTALCEDYLIEYAKETDIVRALTCVKQYLIYHKQNKIELKTF